MWNLINRLCQELIDLDSFLLAVLKAGQMNASIYNVFKILVVCLQKNRHPVKNTSKYIEDIYIFGMNMTIIIS